MVFWRVREALRPFKFWLGVFALGRLHNVESALQLLRGGWGNEGWSADISYLHAIHDFAKATSGPILECGSGLSTLILGIVAPGRTVSLEHIPEWKQRVSQIADRYSIPVRIVDAPLIEYGSFQWYRIPADLNEHNELVICDGPPSSTPGGRYGLLPVAGKNLASSSTILMDDAEREDERKIVERWKKEFDISSEFVHSDAGEYAVVRYRRST